MKGIEKFKKHQILNSRIKSAGANKPHFSFFLFSLIKKI